MQTLELLWLAALTWVGVTTALIAILITLVLRHKLPPARRQRGTATLSFLTLALLLNLSARAALQTGFYNAWALLSALDLLSLVLGLTGLAHLVVFDLVLNQTRLRVPSILQNLIHAGIVFLIVLTLLYQRGFDPFSLFTTSAVLRASEQGTWPRPSPP